MSSHLKITSCATFASFYLWNVKPISGVVPTGAQAYSPENLEIINSITGTKDEEWFFVISASIEAEAGRIIPEMPAVIKAASHHHEVVVHTFLLGLSDCLARMCNLLDRMYERCNPSVFYDCVRRFLAGSKEQSLNGLPCGIYYEDKDGPGKWLQYTGGSNAQSSVIQLFDIILGVTHSMPSAKQSFHKVSVGFSSCC